MSRKKYLPRKENLSIMKAVIIENFGDVEGSVLKDGIPIPKPNRDQVLIKVRGL